MKLIKIFTAKTGKDRPYLFEIEESKGYYVVNQIDYNGGFVFGGRKRILKKLGEVKSKTDALLLAEASVKESITNKIVE